MILRRPTAEDLLRAAETNYLELTEEELADFQALIPGQFASFDLLELMPCPPQPIKYKERDPGYRPSKEDDPLNVIVRRCSVKGAASGKLAGKRVGLKDNICVAGVPMTCASLVLDGYVPDVDATIVTRLLDAGAEIVAKLNMDNFAFSGRGDTSSFGPQLNPHNPQHLTGGSSGGSGAALYYDYVDITMGGDQGGSIRIPASWCGVVGLKPTYGLVPYTGIVGIDHTCDHTGPMGRTVADVALTLEVIAGKDPLDPRQGQVRVQKYTEAIGAKLDGLHIGILKEGFGVDVSEADVDTTVRKALKEFSKLGAKVTEISIPAHADALPIVWGVLVEGMAALWQSNGLGYHWQGFYNTSLAEALGKFRRTQADDLSPTLKLTLLVGTYLNERYHGRLHAKAQNLRRVLRSNYDKALGQVDVLAMPTTPMKAHKYDPEIDRQGIVTLGLNMLNNTAPFNVTGHPAISIPCGKSKGLPVGLMLVTKHFQESTLFRAAHAFEQHINWESF